MMHLTLVQVHKYIISTKLIVGLDPHKNIISKVKTKTDSIITKNLKIVKLNPNTS